MALFSHTPAFHSQHELATIDQAGDTPLSAVAVEDALEDMGICYFTNLPLELRNMIYKLVLCDLTPFTYSWPESNFAGKYARLIEAIDSVDPRDRRTKTLHFPSPLAVVSRQIRHEVKACSYLVYRSHVLWVDVPMYPLEAENTGDGKKVQQDLRALVDFRRYVQKLYPKLLEPHWQINFVFSVLLGRALCYSLAGMRRFYEQATREQHPQLKYSFESRAESFADSSASTFLPTFPDIPGRKQVELHYEFTHALRKRGEELDRLYGAQRLTTQERKLLKPLDFGNFWQRRTIEIEREWSGNMITARLEVLSFEGELVLRKI